MKAKMKLTKIGCYIFLTVMAFAMMGVSILPQGFTNYIIHPTTSAYGIDENARVEYNGIPVGKVTQVILKDANPKNIEIHIAVKKEIPITEGTLATITTRGITGIYFISLEDEGKNLKPLLAQADQSYPIIPFSARTGIENTEMAKMSEALQQMNNTIQTVFSGENIEAIKQLLYSTQEVMTVLATNNKRINSLLINSEKASYHITPFLKSSRGTLQTINIQTLPTVNQLINNLDRITRDMSNLVNDLNQNPSIVIRGKERTVYGPGETK